MDMFRNLKLTPKFFLIFFLITIVPLSIVAAYSTVIIKAALSEQVINSLKAVNTSRVSYINHLIQLRQEQAKQLSGAILLKKLNPNGENSPDLKRDIQNHIDAIYSELKLSPSSDYKHIDQSTDIEVIGIWDASGHIIANTNRKLLGEQMPPLFLDFIRKRGVYFGGFQKYSTTNEKFLFFLDEIRSKNNDEFAGNVTLMVKAKIMNDITTARQGLGSTGETYIVNKQLNMITESRFIENAVLNQRVITEATNACFNGKNAPSIYVNYRGVSVLGVQTFLSDQQWCLISEINESEAFSLISYLRYRIILITSLMMVIISGFAFRFSRLFIKPILRLSKATSSVAEGHYGMVIPKGGSDEIGELSNSFNKMTQSLEEAKRQIEKKNEDLENNLEITNKQKKDLEKVNQRA